MAWQSSGDTNDEMVDQMEGRRGRRSVVCRMFAFRGQGGGPDHQTIQHNTTPTPQYNTAAFGVITSPRVLDAFRVVDRAFFVPERVKVGAKQPFAAVDPIPNWPRPRLNAPDPPVPVRPASPSNGTSPGSRVESCTA